MFFPAGELLSELVAIDQGNPTYRAFFLIKICSPLLGLCWPMDIGIDEFLESLKLHGHPYKPFLQSLDSIQSALESWFQAVDKDPSAFTIPACSYSSIEVSAFPAFTDGIYPATIVDHYGLSPLMDMRYGLAWHLHCDKVLTLTTGPGLQHFRTFLQHGADGIMPNVYLCVTIPGRFCPNFGFHF
jgi:hypothetical protein